MALVSPDVIRREMERVAQTCREVAQLAQVVADTYDELHEQSLSPTRIGDGVGGSRHSRDLGSVDPTGDTATSPLHRRMRRQAMRAARELRKLVFGWHCPRCDLALPPVLIDAEALLKDGFLELDPEIAERLAQMREAR